MKISIGILAYNEEKRLPATLDSLFRQSVFHSSHDDLGVSKWEIFVIPNGCTDSTTTVAQTNLQVYCKQSQIQNKVCWEVTELTQPSKSNAWNYFIHDLIDDSTTFVIMLDADIVFDHIDTIYNTVQELQTNTHAEVVVDLPLKHFAKKEKKTLIEKISTLKSKQTFQGDPGVAGSFYCSRAKTLKQIWMPIGLSGEDGFLRAMIITNQFRSAPDPRKVARADNATHYYEGLTKINAIIKHELRMLIGTTLNCYFCWDFLLFATEQSGPGAGYLIKSKMSQNPDWYKEYIENEVKNRGFWVLPQEMLFSRLVSLRKSGIRNLPRTILFFFIYLFFELPLMLMANHKIKKGAIGYW